jgi:futalosine hydrolase
MHIAIVAATEFEIEDLRQSVVDTPHDILFHLHGVGMMQATYHLQKVASQKPDLILQVGIAGSYRSAFETGSTVVVEREYLGDTGAEDQQSLLDLFDLGFLKSSEEPFSGDFLPCAYVKHVPHLPHVRGLTVNKSCGSNDTYLQRLHKYQPDIESMEGACLHYVALMEKIPFIQFRGISNTVGIRDKKSWVIQDAINSCQQEVISFLNRLKPPL